MPGPSGTTPVLELPYPIPGDTVDVPRDIQALAEKLDPVGTVPVGAVTMWMTNVPPDGWLLLTGQTVSATTYPGLAGIFGQAGGNVTLPDLAGRFPVGASTGDMALGQRNGANRVRLAIGEIPAHDHSGPYPGLTGMNDRPLSHNHTVGDGYAVLADRQVGNGGFAQVATTDGGMGWFTGDAPTGTSASPDHYHGLAPNGGGGEHENRPLYLAVNFIIRAG